ncbi:hypothetical protein NLX71_25960 [Paenibacillus sp. MZ04-78.2]|uniref:hypothetical protein n=1 Tax=Paenibacillus sp. MZ04-78.2 TaxID=2962034 RepID=UPI0020B8D023|nr:hypothetical protein [Paenibacillus sp. MZ04-78.2]MCP3776688.1 hypothetical protein [Paenibacillus sp. MZ04-78.2]
MLENMILISNNDEPFPDRIEIQGGLKIPDMSDVVQKFSIALSFLPPSNAINLERKIKYVQPVIAASSSSTFFAENSQHSALQSNAVVPQDRLSNSSQASLTLEELRTIIHNWVQNINSGENNVI